jgi:amidase
MSAPWSRRRFVLGTSAAAGGALLLGPRLARGAPAPAPPPAALPFASATAAARALRRREISSVELTTLVLDRIDRYNPKLGAIVTVLREDALVRARQADALAARGAFGGPLHGVPVTVKESFGIAGVRQTAGAGFLRDHVASEDSVAVARLRAAGAILVGNTNVPFLLGDWQSYNDIYGQTNNPWDLARTPGGSTGGGAAALAAGLGYLTLGSDIGGSIRLPAHFCGVYGHKPTLNIVPHGGHIPPLPQLEPASPPYLPVAGPLARSADDLALALECVGGPDPEDAIAYRWTLPKPRAARLADYRVGFLPEHPLCPVASDARRPLTAAIEALRGAGVRLDEGLPKALDAAADLATYKYLLAAVRAGGATDEEIEDARAIAKRGDASDDVLQARAWTDPHKRFEMARTRQLVARAAWQEYFRNHDVFLMPVAPVAAFAHDHGPLARRSLATPEGPRPYGDLLFYAMFATFTGLPATVAPVGATAAGLPVGIQILGPYLEDATPIDFAARLAEVVGGFRPPPGYAS